MARRVKPPLDRAYTRALRLLAASDRSERELRERLERAGFEPSVIDGTLARLRNDGVVDDRRLARAVREKSRRALEAPALIEARLERRGIREAAEPGAASLAVAAARAAAMKLPATLSPAARFRRVLAALARKGYDEQAALDAAAEVLGPAPERD